MFRTTLPLSLSLSLSLSLHTSTFCLSLSVTNSFSLSASFSFSLSLLNSFFSLSLSNSLSLHSFIEWRWLQNVHQNISRQFISIITSLSVHYFTFVSSHYFLSEQILVRSLIICFGATSTGQMTTPRMTICQMLTGKRQAGIWTKDGYTFDSCLNVI